MIRGASENRSVTSWGPLGTSGEGEEWGEGGGLVFLADLQRLACKGGRRICKFTACLRMLLPSDERFPILEATDVDLGPAIIECMWCQHMIYMAQSRSATTGRSVLCDIPTT